MASGLSVSQQPSSSTQVEPRHPFCLPYQEHKVKVINSTAFPFHFPLAGPRSAAVFVFSYPRRQLPPALSACPSALQTLSIVRKENLASDLINGGAIRFQTSDRLFPQQPFLIRTSLHSTHVSSQPSTGMRIAYPLLKLNVTC